MKRTFNQPFRKIAALTFAFSLAVPFAASDNVLLFNEAHAAGTTSSIAAASSTSAASSVRPATQSFALMIKGDYVNRTAYLKQGNGYSLYVANGYTFNKAQNKIYLTQYPSYNAQIEKLPANFNLQKVSKKSRAELKKYGQVRSYKGDQSFESPMSSARLLLQASDTKGNLHNHVIWTSKKGDSYLFRINAPTSEFGGTFIEVVSNSLTSILTDK
ncbi:hypothetical protein [Saccharibacillus sp. JS10]|uniref:hypothetical protein n=1 Tax=Saccharibacillus sp. JS10 TaxID=2950552 RepID=UPI00210D053D|nr:hypothetical protein [Saccharibacillus sp. JS10]MCQ4087502.1 hypothetical protein [Saccharibacillus sp. JS10]